MGQYYTPTIIDEDNTIHSLHAHAYDNGLKLMEHSYVGNNFVNAVLTQIWHNPARIAWIGNYSNTTEGDAWEHILPKEVFMAIYEKVWGDDESTRIQPQSRSILTMKNNRRYLVNHDKHVYINLREYVEQNKWHEEGDYHKYPKSRSSKARPRLVHYSYDICVNPLPLLTACGNGRGGGDYHDSYPDFDKVGTWAFDHIEYTGINPAKLGYTPVMYSFTEQTKEEK